MSKSTTLDPHRPGSVVRDWLGRLVRTAVDATFRPRTFLARWEETEHPYLDPRSLLAFASAELGLVTWVAQRVQEPQLETAMGTRVGPVGDAALDVAYSLFALLGVWILVWGATLTTRWFGSSTRGWTPAFKAAAFASIGGVFWTTPSMILAVLAEGGVAEVISIVLLLTTLVYGTLGFKAVYRLSLGRALGAYVVAFVLLQVVFVTLGSIAGFVAGFETGWNAAAAS